jgi:hypothetical protein
MVSISALSGMISFFKTLETTSQIDPEVPMDELVFHPGPAMSRHSILGCFYFGSLDTFLTISPSFAYNLQASDASPGENPVPHQILCVQALTFGNKNIDFVPRVLITPAMTKCRRQFDLK